MLIANLAVFIFHAVGVKSIVLFLFVELKEEMLDRYAEDFRKEIAVMEELKHANIVKFHGVCRGGNFTKFFTQRNFTDFNFMVSAGEVTSQNFLHKEISQILIIAQSP